MIKPNTLKPKYIHIATFLTGATSGMVAALISIEYIKFDAIIKILNTENLPAWIQAAGSLAAVSATTFIFIISKINDNKHEKLRLQQKFNISSELIIDKGLQTKGSLDDLKKYLDPKMKIHMDEELKSLYEIYKYLSSNFHVDEEPYTLTSIEKEALASSISKTIRAAVSYRNNLISQETLLLFINEQQELVQLIIEKMAYIYKRSKEINFNHFYKEINETRNLTMEETINKYFTNPLPPTEAEKEIHSNNI